MSLQPPAATSLPNRSKTPAPKNRPIDLPMAQADANDDLTTIPSHLTVEAFLKSTSSAKPRTRKQITYKRKRSKTRQNTLQGGLIPEIADSFDDDDVPLSELAKHTRKQQKPQSARPRTRRRISGTHASRRGSSSRHEGELQNMRQLTKTGPQSVDYHESPQSASLEAKGGTLKKGAHRDPMLSSLQALDFEDVDTSSHLERDLPNLVAALEFRRIDLHSKPRVSKSVRFRSINTHPRRFATSQGPVKYTADQDNDRPLDPIAPVAVEPEDVALDARDPQILMPTCTAALTALPHDSNTAEVPQPAQLDASSPGFGEAWPRLIQTQVPSTGAIIPSRKQPTRPRNVVSGALR
ncbi:hypothetical protein FRB97_004898 [Tulasnella sp. 331]|nr:hypothetical protein FRB97_004898 [Tulasnella sp. 331]